VEEFGFFVQGTKLPAEGLVHIQALADDYYHFDRGTHSLVGRRAGHSYQLGEMVQVEIVHVDPDRRELDFRLVKKLGGGPTIHLPRTSQGDRRRDKRLSAGSGEHFAAASVGQRPKKSRAGRDGTAEPNRPAGRRKKKSRKAATTPFARKEPKKPAGKRKSRPGKRERQARKRSSE
jgi:ribonuclease R